MTDYLIVHILDLVNSMGENSAVTYLSRFTCPQNSEIEDFIRYKAIDFARRKLSMTHLVIDNSNGKFVGYFTLAHKPILVKDNVLSKTAMKNISRFAKYDEKVNAYVLSAFLVAQIGKNYSIDASEHISGNELMKLAYNTLTDVQHQIGGGVVFLECEDNQKLLNFYTQEPNLFRVFGERFSETDETKYLQLLRFM